MSVYLNKKIAVPNCRNVGTISWSYDHDFIACGGDNGLLRVIKLDSNIAGKSSKAGAIKNLTFNQTLEGHTLAVQATCWNDPFQKLTSCDENGSIIVWMFYKGMWHEEMVNNRNKSVPRDMAWAKDGTKICIIYDDGAIITGSVDGNRIWGKDTKNINMCKVDWSPDGRIILIATHNLELHIFDSAGNFMRKVQLTTLASINVRGYHQSRAFPRVICLRWCKTNEHARPLLMALEDGCMFMMKNENDSAPLTIDCEMRITSAKWNYTGDMIAVTGKYEVSETNKNCLKLYNTFGEFMHTTKVPGAEINDCAWHKFGVKLALAVDSYIFFATVKSLYHWAYLGSSIVIILNDTNDSDNAKKIVFFDVKSNRCYERSVHNFMLLTSWSFSCGVVSKLKTNEQDNKKAATLSSLTIYNSVGTPIDQTVVHMDVVHACMNSTRMVIASGNSFLVWNFTNIPNYKSNKMDNNVVDAMMSSREVNYPMSPTRVDSSDPIACMGVSEKYLIVAHDSGQVSQYLFPSANLVHKLRVDCIPSQVALNRNSSKLSMIDKSNKLYIYDFDASNEQTSTEGSWLDLDQRDVCDLQWSSDDNDLFAVVDKNKLIIYNVTNQATQKEEAITLNGYIGSFQQLTVQAISLDNLVCDYASGQMAEVAVYIETIECEWIRKLRDKLEDSLTEAVNYILQLPNHPVLWKVISEKSLLDLDLETAKLAMIKIKDFVGIQFIKKLEKIQDDVVRKGEVYTFLERFEDAQHVYLKGDRPDLAIHLNKLLGRYHTALKLLDEHRLLNYEKEVAECRQALGEQLADDYNWMEAVQHLEKVECCDRLIECYIHLDNYNALVSLIPKIQDKKQLLEIAMFLESVGMCKECTKAYCKAGEIQMALDACMAMSEWKTAIDIAHDHNIQHIDTLLNKYSQHLLEENRYVEIIEVYRKARRLAQATEVIGRLITQLVATSKGNAFLFKKLYVLIGLLHRDDDLQTPVQRNTLDKLITSDEVLSENIESTKFLEDPWKGAEAYHLLILAQKHLYGRYFDLAMKTALHLQEYEDIIPPEEIYCLIALTSYNNKCFRVCSKAFIKLEGVIDPSNQVDYWLDDSSNTKQHKSRNIPEERQLQYEQLAMQIFSTNPLNDERLESEAKIECKFCGTMIAEWSTRCASCHIKFTPCMASGASIFDPKQQWTCKQCLHHALKTEIKSFINCPLCHYKI